MKFKLRPFFKDVSLTFITQTIVLIAFFFIYRLIAKNFGPEGVGEYALVKRVIALISPLLLLGLGVGIPRYIAMSKDETRRSAYLKTGALIIIFFTFIFLIFVNLFKEYFAQLFFGTAEYIILVFPFSLFLGGLILHTLIYAYFRGRLLVKTFNSLQIMNLALVPIGILVFFRNITIEELITLIGITTFAIASVFLLFFVKDLFVRIEKWQFKNSLKELLRYGLPRVPGDFALAGLLSLGPIFAVHLVSVKEVGYLSISQSLLSTVGTVMAPLGLILLPKISNLIVNGRIEIIKENLTLLIGVIFQLSIFASFQFIIFADIIIKYWLGPDFLEAVVIMQIIFFSLIFYTFYVATRSILDAAKVKPLNTINVSVSLGVFLFLSGILLFLFKFFTPIISLSIAFASALICLGVLTYISIRKIYPEETKRDLYYFGTGIAINVLLGIIAFLTKPFIGLNFYYLFAFLVLISVVYLSILWLLKMEWIRQIPKIIFGKYV